MVGMLLFFKFSFCEGRLIVLWDWYDFDYFSFFEWFFGYEMEYFIFNVYVKLIRDVKYFVYIEN